MSTPQTPGASGAGGRGLHSPSPGGNSPVLGGTGTGMGLGMGSSATGGVRHSSDLYPPTTHAELPHRPLTPQDETIRAGQHRYPRPTGPEAEWYENSNLPVWGLVAAGGLLAGWLLSGVGRSSHRSHAWEEQRYAAPRRGREHDYGTRGRGNAPAASRSLPTDETRDLIASNKVEGTAVYDRNGERLGSVYNFVVGKRSGQVAYAVMSFGGWLGMGGSYHPLPWNALTYDTNRGGYVVNLDKDRLRNAPSHKADHDTSSDPGFWRRVADYWA